MLTHSLCFMHFLQNQCLEDAVNQYTNGTDWSTTYVDVYFERNVLSASIVIGGSPPFPKAEDIPQEEIITNVRTLSQ